MENEKKNQPQREEQGHKRHRPHKKKGYFMEPPVQGGTEAAQKPREEQKTPTESHSDEKRNAAGNPHGRGNRPPRRNDRQGKPQDKADKTEQKEKNEKPERTEKPEKPNGNPIAEGDRKEGGSGRNRRRNRHRGKKPTEEQAESAVSRTPEVSEASPEKKAAPERRENKPRDEQKNRRSGDRLTRPTREAPAPHAVDDGEYEEIRFPAPGAESDEPVLMPDLEEATTEDDGAPTVEVVGIRFKSTGKVYYFAPGGNTVRRGQHAIVETARGQEYGEVAMGNTYVKETDIVPPLRPILRVATEADKKHHLDNKEKENSAFRICNEKISAHKLDMKLIDAQYTFDNSKLLFYFTSAGRVDFRDLVKDLASVFRTRIELRQIGIRDEAKLMGGIGMCGRPLCCTLFLSDFGQVSIKMAKEQNLSLNSAKISGICGRLMCCLRYEHETYEYEIKRTPPVDALVRTEDGNGTVTEVNPLVGTVKVRLLATPEVAPKTYRRENVVMLKKKNEGKGKSKSERNEKNDAADENDA